MSCPGVASVGTNISVDPTLVKACVTEEGLNAYLWHSPHRFR